MNYCELLNTDLCLLAFSIMINFCILKLGISEILIYEEIQNIAFWILICYSLLLFGESIGTIHRYLVNIHFF